MTDPIAPVFVDDPQAHEVFVSECAGAAFDNGNVRLTFAAYRVNHASNPGQVSRVVNLRIVIPIPNAIAMADFMRSFLQASALNQTQKPPEQPLQ